MKRNKILFWFFITALALFLRVFHIENQSLMFFDEGAQLMRIQAFDTVMSDEDAVIAPHYYVDTKILWQFLIFIFQLLYRDVVFDAHALSIFFGMLSIPVTYLLAGRIFKSEAAGLLAAGFLAVSPFHVYLSRLAFSETANMFFTVLSMYLYLRATEARKLKPSRELAAMAGVCLAAALLVSHFRALFVPGFFILIELYVVRERKEVYRKDYFRFPLTIVILVLTAFLATEAIRSIYVSLGINVASYFEGLQTFYSAVNSQRIMPDFASFGAYPFIISQIEGRAFYVLGAMSLLFVIKKPRPTWIILACVVIHLMGFGLFPEKGDRVLSTVVPLLSVLYAATVLNLYSHFERNRTKRYAFFAVIFFVWVTGLKQSLEITRFRSDIGRATELINRLDPESGILTTDIANVTVYSVSKNVYHLFQTDLKLLREYYAMGYRYILTDPIRQASALFNEKIIDHIDQHCRPIKRFENFENSRLQKEFYLYSGVWNYPVLIEMLGHVDRLDMSLSVYDTQSCLETLERQKP